jgi:integrase
MSKPQKRKDSPYWWYDFQIDGDRFRGSTKESAYREAQRFIRDLKKRIRAGDIPVDDVATVAGMYTRYWDDHARHLPSADTLSYYTQAVQSRLPMGLKLADLSNAHVAKYVAERRLEVGPATVNREVATLRAAHRMAGEEWEWPTRAISWRKHMLKEPQSRERWITQDEAALLLAALPGHIADAVRWSLLTGCRRAETTALAWPQVDLTQRTARILGKGQRWDTIELNAGAFELLANLRPDDKEKRAGQVFDLTNRRKHWTAACETAALSDFRWHDLRHTFATWMRQQGASLELVQEALRHADIATTRRYAHVGRDELRAAVELVRLDAKAAPQNTGQEAR